MAFFGGGFNPPHIAHVMAVAYVQAMGQFDRVHIVPCWRHAFDKDSKLIGFDHRVEMCRLAFSDPPDVGVLLTEKFQRTRYTVDLVEYLRGIYFKSDYDLTLIIGSDNLAVMPDWHRWQDLKALVDFFVLPRAGSTELPFSLPDISSTQVRKALADGVPVDALVPPAVLDYIRAHGLYTEKTS